MIKTIVIIVLVLLVLGLYFVPGLTKGVIKSTGRAVAGVIERFFQDTVGTQNNSNKTIVRIVG